MKHLFAVIILFFMQNAVAGIFYVASDGQRRSSLEDAWKYYATTEAQPNKSASCQPVSGQIDMFSCRVQQWNGGTTDMVVNKTGRCNLGDSLGTYDYPVYYGYDNPDAPGGATIVQKIAQDGDGFNKIFCVNSCQAVVANINTDVGDLYSKPTSTPGILLYKFNVKLTESSLTCTVALLPNTNAKPYEPPKPVMD